MPRSQASSHLKLLPSAHRLFFSWFHSYAMCMSCAMQKIEAQATNGLTTRVVPLAKKFVTRTRTTRIRKWNCLRGPFLCSFASKHKLFLRSPVIVQTPSLPSLRKAIRQAPAFEHYSLVSISRFIRHVITDTSVLVFHQVSQLDRRLCHT